MKTLVSGGAGFIGSHLVDRLLEQGDEVLVLDILSQAEAANLAHRRGHPKLKFVVHDIAKPLPDAVRRFAPDRIFNLACSSSHKQRSVDALQGTMTCVAGTQHLLELAAKCGARFLQGSSSGVYGDPAVHPQPEHYLGNVNAVGPRSAHDEANRCAEALCVTFQEQHGVDVRIARIFSTYGPRMSADDGRVLGTFITQALRGDDLVIHGDGTQSRAFCYVDDMVDGLIKLMESGTQGPVNLGHVEEQNLLQVAERVLRLTASLSRVNHGTPRPEDPHSRRPDLTRAERSLGWRPRVPLQQGLQHTVEFFRQRSRAPVHA